MNAEPLRPFPAETAGNGAEGDEFAVSAAISETIGNTFRRGMDSRSRSACPTPYGVRKPGLIRPSLAFDTPKSSSAYVPSEQPALAIGLVVCSFHALGDERFARFLDANPALENTVCAYTTTATSSQYPGETRVDRFSPANGWQLVSINGEPPSPQALADYAGEAKQRNRDRQQPADQDFAKMVRMDSVKVVEEDPATLVFAFSPQARDTTGGRAMAEKMAGTLTVAKDTFRPPSSSSNCKSLPHPHRPSRFKRSGRK